jgi:hypothetical protein
MQISHCRSQLLAIHAVVVATADGAQVGHGPAFGTWPATERKSSIAVSRARCWTRSFIPAAKSHGLSDLKQGARINVQGRHGQALATRSFAHGRVLRGRQFARSGIDRFQFMRARGARKPLLNARQTFPDVPISGWRAQQALLNAFGKTLVVFPRSAAGTAYDAKPPLAFVTACTRTAAASRGARRDAPRPPPLWERSRRSHQVRRGRPPRMPLPPPADWRWRRIPGIPLAPP